ncbi:MAG: AMP-binding protein [Burkholderiales bacterium]
MVTPPLSAPLPDSMRSVIAQWTVATLVSNVLWTRTLGRAAIEAAQRQRFADLAAHARLHSPYFRRAWRHLPAGPIELADVPPTAKGTLMAAFDDWCTDRAVCRRDVDAFVGTRTHIGERFRDRYLVWTSSGTTGTPGIFVQDAAALAAYDALVSVQLVNPRGAGCDWNGAAALGGRAALVTADGGHFASIVSWRRVAHGKPWLDMKSFPVTLPLPELVAALNAYRPAFVASYPTVLTMLADEQRAGRLHLRSAGLWAGGEVLSPAAHAAIERAFDTPVHNEYGASECLSIGYACSERRMHVNADWVILEPVDERHRPVPPGTLSHTVLLTNLANNVQPIIRYDLGDRVRWHAEPCPCGDPLPAIDIVGRKDDVITLPTRDGPAVRLPPLALSTVVEESALVYLFQIVQTAPDCLALRLSASDRAACSAPALAALRDYLDAQGLAHVAVRLDPGEPQPDARDGKLRQVIAYRAS